MKTQNFLCSRNQALKKLAEFIPKAGSFYAEQRNFDYGPAGVASTSRLSPAIARRILSEEEVIAQVLAQHSFEQSQKFIQEVVWRTYWKGWLEWHPDVWRKFCGDCDAWGDKPVSAVHAQALSGQTGIKAFDFWRQELADTGFLHNHARMWFASIWIFTLKLPWQLGAKLFLQELIDADAASNTLSWRWVAGLQTLGKSYQASESNIAKYTAGRFAPQGLLAQDGSPLTESALPTRKNSLPLFEEESPSPGRIGLLVHREDLSLEQTNLCQLNLSAVATVHFAESGYQCARFDREAEQDFHQRATAFSCPVRQLEREADFRSWAAGLDAVVVSQPCTGVLKDHLWPWLQRCPKPVWLARRDYDIKLYPHATRGYFHFRKQLPSLIRQLTQASPQGRIRYRRMTPDEQIN